MNPFGTKKVKKLNKNSLHVRPKIDTISDLMQRFFIRSYVSEPSENNQVDIMGIIRRSNTKGSK